MAISGIHHPSSNEISAALPSAGRALQTDSLSFAEVLNKATTTPPDGWPNKLPPLSKAQLLHMINDIKTQMNNRLLRTLSSDGNETADIRYIGLFDRFILPGVESSKKQQINQKNDVFRVRQDLEPIIRQAAEAHGVDPALIKSIIKVESNFNPNSTSPKGAMGLMQLMPGTARDLGVRNAYDPAENVMAGAGYLKMLLKRYDGDVNLALAAYNWGMGNLEKRPERMPSETKSYVANVMHHYEQARS